MIDDKALSYANWLVDLSIRAKEDEWSQPELYILAWVQDEFEDRWPNEWVEARK